MAELTWKDIVVATTTVADRHHEPATTWFRWAGVLEKADDPSVWKTRYDGDPIDDWEVPVVIRTEINEELAKIQGSEPVAKQPKVRAVPASADLIKLDVPYLSQQGADASSHLADCGPTCLAMLINAAPVLSKKRTVDKLYELHLKKKGKQDYSTWTDMKRICVKEDLEPERINNSSRAQALEDLRSLIRSRRPFVTLVRYSFWEEASRVNRFGGSHFVLVTGFDKKHVYVHDPLFPVDRPNRGEFYQLTTDAFLNGWGGFKPKVNPNFSRLATQKAVDRLTG